MKTKMFATVLFLLFFICSCSDNSKDRNPYLLENEFSFDINMNLPLYNSLNTPGNSVYIGNEAVGIKGIFVINTGGGFYAWEASCPNHSPNDCSTMTIKGGTNCICPCEDYEYNLFNGQMLNRPDTEDRTYDLLFYQTQVSGSTVRVYNN
ncbi:Rieske (2Fe-2S) protein [Sinomicrobium sp. M5D2P9]